MDYRTKERSDGLLLFADAARLGRICRCTNDAPLGFLCCSPDLVFDGAFRKNDGMHVASGVAFNFVVAENPDCLAAPSTNHSLSSARLGHGLDRRLVGKISPGDARSAFCAGGHGAAARGESCFLVLLEQTFLAFQPHVHLSAMERSCAGSACLSLVVRDRRILCG